MHAGFRVLEAPPGGGLRVTAEYTAHGVGQALGYGADWARGAPAAEGGLGAATASFYDKLLHTWEVRGL